MQRPIFLIGFMGSGKTTWGKKLANTLGVPFIDLDHKIVNKIGMSIPDYFTLHGEEQFRKIEKEQMQSLEGVSGIISTGGGTPCFFDNMNWLLNNGLVIYLKHSPKSLWHRLNQSDISKRPALTGMSGQELLSFIENKLEEREPYYNQAHLQVDQLNTNLEDLVKLVQENSQPNEK